MENKADLKAVIHAVALEYGSRPDVDLVLAKVVDAEASASDKVKLLLVLKNDAPFSPMLRPVTRRSVYFDLQKIKADHFREAYHFFSNYACEVGPSAT